MANINTAAIALESAAKAFDEAAVTVTKDFSTLSADASSVMRKLDPVLDDARTAMANVNDTVATINTQITPAAARAFRQVGNTATDFQSVMARLQQLLAQIEQDPSRFVYQQPSPVER
jgi:ABC-type transporter Mla subunit MlaD